MFSGFRRGVNGTFVLLARYVGFIGSYRQFGTTYRSHIRATLEDETAVRIIYQLNGNISLFGSTCFGLYAHLQEQIEFILQMRHMVPCK